MMFEGIDIMPSARDWVSDGQQFPVQGANHLMVETGSFMLTRKVYFP